MGPRSALCALASFALCLAGCAGTGAFLDWGEQKPNGEPCRVVVAWNPAVVFTPDAVHGGDPIPGLAGRVYLFGPEIGYPLLGNGGLHVDLFDDTKSCAGQASTPLEQWTFDPETLKRLQHHDPIGWGYTVFLPWATYKPEITQIHLKVRYEPPQGFPIYAASGPITLLDPEHMGKWETSVARVIPKVNSVPNEASGMATASTQGIASAAAQQPSGTSDGASPRPFSVQPLPIRPAFSVTTPGR